MEHRFNDTFVVITGGPGTGKSALIAELASRGYRCIEEVARRIIQEQMAAGGDALPWKDTIRYRNMMLARSVETYHAAGAERGAPLFFDRGIPDVVGYSHIIGATVEPELDAAARNLRYHPRAFITPPWKEIYATDTERKQTFEESIEVYETMLRVYPEYGYELVEIPKASIAERADFILRNISAAMDFCRIHPSH